MRLTVIHTTAYAYRRPVRFHAHRLMLRPRGGPHLRVLSHTLSCAPEAALTWSEDVFGNLVATATFDAAGAELRIESRLRVETSAEAWPVFPILPRAQTYPFTYEEDEAVDLGPLRDASGVDPDVAAWAKGFVSRAGTDTLSLLKDINAGVGAQVRYRVREEAGTQDGATTLREGSGSCRDLAALFNEAVRSLGFGARAVSGYLIPGADAAPAADTTHAWAEVYIPGAGWIPFDPTHGRVGAAGLLAVAIGRCNAQVLPVTGGYAGEPGDQLSMTVSVDVRPNEAET